MSRRNSPHEFLNEQKELAARVIETLPPVGKMNANVIREVVRTQSEVIDEMDSSVDKAITRTKRTEIHNLPIKLSEKATNFIESIDVNILDKMNDSELQRLRHQISRLEEAIARVKENI